MNGNGGHCDKFRSTCDPYIVLFVSGKEDFRTKTHHNVLNPDFREIYTSKEPIPMNANILIEMWDRDSCEKSDVMWRWALPREAFLHPEYELTSNDNRNKMALMNIFFFA